MSENSSAPIWQFHVTERDRKKARRFIKHLSLAAPENVAKRFRATPIVAKPRMRKNIMIAVDQRGVPELRINLKTGIIDFINNDEVPQ